jgi:hypothetical protein
MMSTVIRDIKFVTYEWGLGRVSVRLDKIESVTLTPENDEKTDVWNLDIATGNGRWFRIPFGDWATAKREAETLLKSIEEGE